MSSIFILLITFREICILFRLATHNSKTFSV